MEIIPIKTSVLNPVGADLEAFLMEHLCGIEDGDVLVLSSKMVALGEGRIVPIGSIDKAVLVHDEADVLIHRDYATKPLTITNHAFISASGIDESNGDGYYVLLPEDSFASAARIHTLITEKFKLKNVGIVITDSHSQPFRQGAIGVALGWWGIDPLESHIGKTDLFGRTILRERSNVVDGIAAAATLVMGETSECQPLALVRQIPNVRFVVGDTRERLLVPYAEDTFRVLYERFLKGE